MSQITEEESNFLRFYFLNLKIASKAVRVYFDYVHPPAGLGAELTKSKVTLKGLRFMTKLQLNILYPSPGQTVTSADFDTTLIVCLLRNMPPLEKAPPTGWDNLPHPGDTSTGADLARVKWFRNQLVHSKDGILSSTEFNHRWSDLEGAIGRLGGPSMLKEAQSAQHVILDRALIDMLNIQRGNYNIHNLQKTQEKHTSMINDLQKAIDNQKIVKEQQETKTHHLIDSLSKGEETIRPTTICSVETMHVLTEVSKSVGYISGPKQSGTCWRVGNDKIITAAHVIIANIWNSMYCMLLEQDLQNIKVDFDYIRGKSSGDFKVEPRVWFLDESLDVAVLQLKPDDQQQLPPPLKMFERLYSQQDEDKQIFLISHNEGFKKEINSGIGIWNPTDKRIKDLKDVCQKYGEPDGYKELDRKDRLIIQCDFVGGASGSPGIVIYNNVAHVVFVYIRGFPSFYYRQQFPEKEKRKFPRDKLLQQGVNIGCLFDTMSKNTVNLTLRNEIFPLEVNLEQHQLAITSDKTSINTDKAKTSSHSVNDKEDSLKSEMNIPNCTNQGGSKQERLEEDTRALIEEDVREDTFVSTKAVTDGLSLLKQNGVLLITGHAGTGKSRIGRHILHMYCTDNISYKCIKLNALNEWEDMVSRENNVVVLLDDIFGETNCIYNREKDTQILDKVYAYVCKGNITVIITIRDTVKRQCQDVFDSHRLFKFDFIDLSSKKYLLRQEEKNTILTKYMKTVHNSDFIESKGYVDCKGDPVLKTYEVWNITRENPVKGFPLAVYQFVHNNKYFELGSKFFDRPTEAMLEEMNAIRRKGEDQRNFLIQYAVMVYTAVNENCINPDDNTTITEIPKIIDAIYGETIKLKKCHISDAVNKLRGSYLINIPNQKSYRLHHPTLQESVILSFAQIDEENINKIIPLISWSFFLKMVKSELYKEKEGEVVLRVPSNSYKLLADRIVDVFIEENGLYKLHHFVHDLCITEIFQHEYSILLPYLLKAFEREDDKDKHTENMIKSGENDIFERHVLQIKNKDIFIAILLNTSAELKSQLDIHNFVLKTFKTIIKTSSNYLTIGFMKSALISSLYLTSSTKDVRCVKATLDIIEENEIPVLLDQGVILTEVPNITSMSTIWKVYYDDEACVFLTLCIWKAYEVFNIPVLEFLLSKYVRNPFDINLFLKIIYKDKSIKNMILSPRKRNLGWLSLSFEPLKWMIETFTDQKLDDPNFILRIACRYQMFDTVEYLASVCNTFDAISCLQAFVNKTDCLFEDFPFNQKLFDFLIKRIDITSKYLISVVKSIIKNQKVPDFMCDAFLPVCINNSKILNFACENGQFYLVNLIIESSHIEKLDIQSALMAACRESKRKRLYHEEPDDEVEKLKIVKYMVEKVELEQFDLKAVCQQACSFNRIKILEWFVQNIDSTRLDVYTIINSAFKVVKRSDILERLMKKIEIESLDKREVLKYVAEHFTAGCSTRILEIVRTIWDSTKDKEVLHIEGIVNTAYQRNYFELLMWIHENCHPHISIDSKKVLMLACEKNRLDVAKWVLQTFEQTSLDIDGGNLFIRACNRTYYIYQEQSIEMVEWILASFQIKVSDFISGVLELPSVTMSISSKSSHSVKYVLKKYFSFLNTDHMKEMINKSVEQKKYFLVNWFLEESGSCTFDKQIVLNTACSEVEIETIKILSKYFYDLDMTQAMIKVCTSPSCLRYEMLEEKDYNANQSVACLNLLWNEVNKIGHDSIDIRTIVSTVCKEKKVRNNIMTWILLKLPLDQIPINEVLITCCQQSKIQHVKYILHKVAIEQLDIRKAFVEACQEFPGDFQFQLQNCKPQCANELWQKEQNRPKFLVIVDSLFQMQSERDSYLSLVQNEIIENKKFDLMLYFLQTGYCRNINMTDRLKEACRYGKCELFQWIVVNVEHKELDIKSAFHEACDGVNYRDIRFGGKKLENIKCLALMWHYIHDMNMFEIDTVLKKMTETSDSNSDDDLKTWLLYIKNIKQRICKSESALLNT